MKLKKSSLLVRWAYLIDNTISMNAASPAVRDCWKVPETTSVCSIFWRSILFTPMAILLAVPSVMVGMVIIIVIGAGSFIRDIVNWIRRKEGSQRLWNKADDAGDVLVEGIRSLYKKVCPLVSIDD